MEWKLLQEDDTVDYNENDNDIELEAKEITLDEDSVDEFVVVKQKPQNPRRAIEILREQKQLEADTWDYFDN